MTELMSTEDLLNRLTPLRAHCRLDSNGDETAQPDSAHPHMPKCDQLGVVAVSGPDAGKFLQGQLTCDVLALAPGEHTLGACCNPQGRMRALFHLVRRDQDFLLLIPRKVVPTFLDALKKYAVFFKASLRDASSEFQLWGVLGAEPVSAVTGHTVITLAGPVARQLVLAPAESGKPALPGADVPPGDWLAAAILAGEPAIYAETIEKLLPHHVNLPGVGGVSFSKGCYTGQEIVARMEYRGKIKTHLRRATTPSTAVIAPGCAVRSGDREVGEVVRSAAIAGGQLMLLSLSDQATDGPDIDGVDAGQSLRLGLPEAPILQLRE